MERSAQAKLGKVLAIGGATLLLSSGISVASGLLAIKHIPPGLTGVALLMEVAGLGLSEKVKDC
ncbi:hypothetical protein H6G20_01175 [Desertifilum sp. FACHB-1129]|uniref:Uncharacterized protein n=1 Tax=Desertifilum tharense IPPAS B-1220 TaxID=1781255 RepID=A0A1E5QFV6_9CYAN|nr:MULTISPECIES: hypothetical protein [Desertifilum]MCD8489343.1 hypothetical protein [Desertifilum sp.]MDA0210347.1 hypothetical protein [Cyanobacteria bacterium FC1]MDI9636079.1 hypothetical protein [Geitlerinema splendidum]MBD2310294.1 hypothetical protein [Desertifilum sp. FACHB-1129]MBD2322670.1 hypothetical protein [Desertifilum sp. FACHB-866]